MTDLPQSSLSQSIPAQPNRARPGPPAEPSFDASHPLIVFDGVCVLCSGFVRMVVRLDRQNHFRFATAQSTFGEAQFRKHGLRTDSYETNLVLIDGVTRRVRRAARGYLIDWTNRRVDRIPGHAEQRGPRDGMEPEIRNRGLPDRNRSRRPRPGNVG